VSRRAFILIGVFWLVLIGGLVGFKQYTLFTGHEVLLRTVPVDPRDLFRGDYVILRYPFSTINLNEHGLDPDRAGGVGDMLYVALEINGGYATFASVHASAPDGLHIKGRVASFSASGPAGEKQYDVEVWYGIESYFVPEGRGREIESRREGLDVRVSIDQFGNAVVRELVIDGEPVTFQ
jgi:uncharacterized membrane-anchored protein